MKAGVLFGVRRKNARTRPAWSLAGID